MLLSFIIITPPQVSGHSAFPWLLNVGHCHTSHICPSEFAQRHTRDELVKEHKVQDLYTLTEGSIISWELQTTLWGYVQCYKVRNHSKVLPLSSKVRANFACFFSGLTRSSHYVRICEDQVLIMKGRKLTYKYLSLIRYLVIKWLLTPTVGFAHRTYKLEFTTPTLIRHIKQSRPGVEM